MTTSTAPVKRGRGVLVVGLLTLTVAGVCVRFRRDFSSGLGVGIGIGCLAVGISRMRR